MRLILILAFLLAGSGWSPPARADEVYDFFQVTCVPELGYFAIRRLSFSNPPIKEHYRTEGLTPGPRAVRAVERRGLFDIEGLEARPQRCVVPMLKPIPGANEGSPGFVVDVVGEFDENSPATSPCRILREVRVSVGGVLVEKLGYGRCGDQRDIEALEVRAEDGAVSLNLCGFADGSTINRCEDRLPLRPFDRYSSVP